MTKVEQVRAWKRANPERVKASERARYLRDRVKRLAYEAQPHRRAKKAARMKAARAADREGSRLKFRAWNYSLTVHELAALLAGGCAVCGSTDRLHVDHDHGCCQVGSSPRSCGRCVRGVLCHGCNTAMGLLAESPDRVAALLAYLRKLGRLAGAA